MGGGGGMGEGVGVGQDDTRGEMERRGKGTLALKFNQGERD